MAGTEQPGPSVSNDTLDILSVIQNLSLDSSLPNQQVHPFSSSQESSVEALKKYVEITGQITQALTAHLPLPFSDTKLLSLFRQYTTIAHNVHMVRIY